jgi:class 3 adenylate cyclase
VLIPADEPCPLPGDPLLAEAALAFESIGQWTWLLDPEWNTVYITHHQRLSFGLGAQLVPIRIGVNYFSTASIETSIAWPVGPGESSFFGDFLHTAGAMMLADYEGRRADLERGLDPRVVDLLKGVEPVDAEVASHTGGAIGSLNRPTSIQGSISRIRDRTGRSRGIAVQWKPAVPMTTLGAMAFDKDPAHLERVQAASVATRQPAALLFGDLEGSSALAKTMSTSDYFNLVRRIVRATDQAIVDHSGIVGRHVGDGVVAFFPVVAAGSESAAARSAVEAARVIKAAMTDVAEQSGADVEAVVVRFGLHWGSRVFIGNISTAARSEVTALGVEVNEAARIEACGTGGRILASKPLVERLTLDDAAAIGIDPHRLGYIQLADLPTATEKARRDAPAIAVCEL